MKLTCKTSVFPGDPVLSHQKSHQTRALGFVYVANASGIAPVHWTDASLDGRERLWSILSQVVLQWFYSYRNNETIGVCGDEQYICISEKGCKFVNWKAEKYSILCKHNPL